MTSAWGHRRDQGRLTFAFVDHGDDNDQPGPCGITRPRRNMTPPFVFVLNADRIGKNSTARIRTTTAPDRPKGISTPSRAVGPLKAYKS